MSGAQNENQMQVPDLQCLPSLCRGIYNRVAQKVGCDPSYVSRVARGERTSREVSEALRAEIQRTWAKLTDGALAADGKNEKKNAQEASAPGKPAF